MSTGVVRILVLVKGIAFGFLVACSLLIGPIECAIGFALSAFFMGMAAVLLHLSTMPPSPPPSYRVLIREKAFRG